MTKRERERVINTAYLIYSSIRYCKGAGIDFVTWRRISFPDMNERDKRVMRGIWRAMHVPARFLA